MTGNRSPVPDAALSCPTPIACGSSSAPGGAKPAHLPPLPPADRPGSDAMVQAAPSASPGLASRGGSPSGGRADPPAAPDAVPSHPVATITPHHQQSSRGDPIAGGTERDEPRRPLVPRRRRSPRVIAAGASGALVAGAQPTPEPVGSGERAPPSRSPAEVVTPLSRRDARPQQASGRRAAASGCKKKGHKKDHRPPPRTKRAVLPGEPSRTKAENSPERVVSAHEQSPSNPIDTGAEDTAGTATPETPETLPTITLAILHLDPGPPSPVGSDGRPAGTIRTLRVVAGSGEPRADPLPEDPPPVRATAAAATATAMHTQNHPFPCKLFEMIQWSTLEHPGVCRWSCDGSSFHIDSKHPGLQSVLKRFFKHSRWLSFSRQLNNYGFALRIQGNSDAATTAMNYARNHSRYKEYHHACFYRDIPDPMRELPDLLPYLPGKHKREIRAREREQKKRKPPPKPTPAKNPSKPATRSMRKEHPAAGQQPVPRPPGTEGDSKALGDSVRLRPPSVVPERDWSPCSPPPRKKQKRSTQNNGDSDNFQVQNDGPKNTPAPHLQQEQLLSRSNDTGSKCKSHSTKKKKRSRKSSRTHKTVVKTSAADNFLKTPSPFRRHNRNRSDGGNGRSSTRFSFWSPPPLSHYLQHKTNPHAGGATTSGDSDAPGASPLPDSLLTVSFLKTPSPIVPTPRASNRSSLSSSPSSSSSPSLAPSVRTSLSTPESSRLSLAFQGSKSTLVLSSSSSLVLEESPSPFLGKNPSTGSPFPSPSTSLSSPSDDGVRMLSWAARAVESPLFVRTRERPGRGPGDTAEAVGAIHGESGRGPVPSNDGGSPPADQASRTTPAGVRFCLASGSGDGGSSPPTRDDGGGKKTGEGPSPLCFRNHEHTETELELLRNCLEDVFVF